MTTELEDRILALVADLGPCTLSRIMDGLPPEVTRPRAAGVVGSLVRFRFLCRSEDIPFVYALHGVDPVLPDSVPRVRRTPRAREGPSIDDRLTAILRRDGCSTAPAMAEETGLTRNCVGVHLRRMEAEGTAVRMGARGRGPPTWTLGRGLP